MTAERKHTVQVKIGPEARHPKLKSVDLAEGWAVVHDLASEQELARPWDSIFEELDDGTLIFTIRGADAPA